MSSSTLSKAVAVCVLSLVGAACSTAQTQTTPRLTQAEAVSPCALGVSGASAKAEDTADGIAITFTQPKRVAELRERGNDAAAQHGPGARMGLGHDGGEHAGGGDHGLQMMQMPSARSVAEDVEGGVRIKFVASDPADQATLRTKLRERVASMNASSCK